MIVKEIIPSERGTLLRKNGHHKLKILVNQDDIRNLIVINGTSFITENISKLDLGVKPNDYYMIINKKKEDIEIKYDQDIYNHEIIYDPYKFENSEKKILEQNDFKNQYNILEGYIDTLPKWYSFKFTYPDYNLIFIKPRLGLSIQIHKYRSEIWEVLKGEPIIINGSKVYYYVEEGTEFNHEANTYHSIINPNKDPDGLVIIKEKWHGKFDEKDIVRVFNPNSYYD